ncbi:MAG: hypothetical protein ACRDF0_06585, partial [Candidatus Limnocylindria bacterium]
MRTLFRPLLALRPLARRVTESDRHLQAIVVRARVALALATLGFVGVAQQAGLLPAEIAVRALAVGLALAFAAGVDELLARRNHLVGASAGTLCEFFAFAIGVALFHPYASLAPALLLWPIVGAAAFLRPLFVVYLGALAAAMVLEIELLTEPGLPDVIGALGWGALYVSVALVAGAFFAAFRRAQRHTETAYASIATLSAASSHGELARILFAYLESTLDLPGDAPAALLVTERAGDTLAAVEARGIDPAARARFRLSAKDLSRLGALAGSGVWVEPRLLPGAALPDALRGGVLFV